RAYRYWDPCHQNPRMPRALGAPRQPKSIDLTSAATFIHSCVQQTRVGGEFFGPAGVAKPLQRAAAMATTGRPSPALEGTELGGKAVAHPTHRLDQLVVILDGQGLAQTADMDVDGALVHVDIATPDVVEDLVPGVDPVLVGQEEGQQAELRGPHGH